MIKMSDGLRKIIAHTNHCSLPKLSKPYNECDYHVEYQIRENILEQHFEELLQLLSKADFNQASESTYVLSSILILYLELQSESSGKTENSKAMESSLKLNSTFKEKYQVTLEEIFMMQSNIFNVQEIFDTSLMELHKRMTVDDIKKYPGLIEAYCVIMNNIKDYKVTLNPPSVLPISLILIEDYVGANKVKGLQCCLKILQCLAPTDFTNGNYYEVVYSSLKKNIVEKDIQVTKYLIECILELLSILPPNVKKNKLDDIFSIVLDQLNAESNLYRKAECFIFVTKLIKMHGINCVKKKVFKSIICDNLDICTDETIREILLQHVIECIQAWIQYCWPVWKLSTDQKLLSSLFKILYVCNDDGIQLQIQNLILTVISLCTTEEQTQICVSLEMAPECTNTVFLKSIGILKQNIKSYEEFYYNIKKNLIYLKTIL